MSEKTLFKIIKNNYPNLAYHVEICLDWTYDDKNDIKRDIDFDVSLVSERDHDRIIDKDSIDEHLFNKNVTFNESDIELFKSKCNKIKVSYSHDGDAEYIVLVSPNFYNPIQYKKYVNNIVKVYKEIVEDKDIEAVLQT